MLAAPRVDPLATFEGKDERDAFMLLVADAVCNEDAPCIPDCETLRNIAHHCSTTRMSNPMNAVMSCFKATPSDFESILKNSLKIRIYTAGVEFAYAQVRRCVADDLAAQIETMTRLDTGVAHVFNRLVDAVASVRDADSKVASFDALSYLTIGYAMECEDEKDYATRLRALHPSRASSVAGFVAAFSGVVLGTGGFLALRKHIVQERDGLDSYAYLHY